jgi:hypothetical protein
MNRLQLEHVIGAAATIAEDTEIVVIGSQSILGQFPEAPPELLVSVEADVYPKNHPERWDLVDGSIGEGSPFHVTFGYYGQGVDETTAVLPKGWKSRLVPISTPRTRGATGLCLEVHDLLISKLVAGRGKDLDFARSVAEHRLANEAVLRARLAETQLDERVRSLVAGRIGRLFTEGTRSS